MAKSVYDLVARTTTFEARLRGIDGLSVALPEERGSFDAAVDYARERVLADYADRGVIVIDVYRRTETASGVLLGCPLAGSVFA
jgi:hypothetical protein